MSPMPIEPPTTLADFDWFWLGFDAVGRLARFDAWPRTARAREPGLFPRWTGQLDLGPAGMMRMLLSLPHGFNRPIRARPHVERGTTRRVTAPEQLSVSPAIATDLLLELHANVADVPGAALRELDGDARHVRLRETDDSPQHAYLHASEGWLRRHWHALAVARAWLPLTIDPAALGAFEYVYDAALDRYMCIAAPAGAVVHLDDLPPAQRHELVSLDVRFGVGEWVRPNNTGQFNTLQQVWAHRRKGR